MTERLTCCSDVERYSRLCPVCLTSLLSVVTTCNTVHFCPRPNTDEVQHTKQGQATENMLFRHMQLNFNAGLAEVCILILRALVGKLFVHQQSHQLIPELDRVSPIKRLRGWASGHGGILWTQLTRTSGHTSSSYTSYFCPIKAAHISFKRNVSLIWSLLPLTEKYRLS